MNPVSRSEGADGAAAASANEAAVVIGEGYSIII
jgi:hypothetical protein